MRTTLNKIRTCSPCTNGWEKLLRNLGKTKADDEPLLITTILDSNGLDDALWCLRAVDGHDREMQLFAVDCAKSVQHLMKDQRSVAAIDVAERYANGTATDVELAAAVDAARAAVNVARAAVDAARAATEAVAVTAVDTAWATAWATAEAAAWATAEAAAWATAEAAVDAAVDAARAATVDAAVAAVDAAWAAAEAAAREVQADFLRVICTEIELEEAN